MSFVSYSRTAFDDAFVAAAKAAGLITTRQRKERYRAEADGNATWCRWLADIPHTTGRLRIDRAAAIAAEFSLS